MSIIKPMLATTCAVSCFVGIAAPAHAQQDPGSSSSSGEIIVTARKREETLIAVPVAISAVSGKEIAARGITNLEGLSRTIPAVLFSHSNGGFQGGALGIRGIGAGDGNLFGDQAVGFYIDGVMIARSTPIKMAELDLEQVEVLKGPQALYYGKNSPAGVVVMRSADPGDHFAAGVRAGYELKAREWRGDAFVSTPLTDSLGLRVAVAGSKMDGWMHNDATPGTIYSPTKRMERLPSARDFRGRVTLKFDDGGPFTARFKFAYSWQKDDGFNSIGEIVSCPLGFPAAGGTGPNDCKANGHTTYIQAGPRFGTGGANTVTGATIAGNPYYGDGVPYSRTTQKLGGLELNYELSDALDLTSTTGFYEANVKLLHMLINDSTNAYPVASPAGVGGSIPAAVGLSIKEISEELRLSSSFDGPVNFMLGGYYQDQKMAAPISASVNALNPIALFPPFDPRQKGKAYSGFASVSIKPTDTIEISGGGRYSHETKKVRFFRLLPGTLGGVPYDAGTEIPTTRPKRSFSNFSPEIMLTWRPNQNYTVYGGWKRGFISGGFNPGGGGTGVALLPDRSYGQEVVEGFELGAKASAFANALRANLALFNYKIKGLQASRIDPATSVQTISNAASARSKGVEFDLNWRTPLEGLTLNGAVAYNKANYLKYDNGPCYGGQSVAAGCDLGPNATLAAAIAGGFNPASGAPFPTGAAYTQQDLSGKPIVRAPRWGIALGANYEKELASGGKIGLSVNGNHSSSYFTDAANAPEGKQPSFWLLDASARFETSNGIEFAIIGRNLTNKFYWNRSADATLTGARAGRPDAIRSDTMAGISRPREIFIRVSYKFGK